MKSVLVMVTLTGIFLTGNAPVMAEDAGRLSERLQSVDTNADQMISRDEINTYRMTKFSEIDIDADGLLSADEVSEYRERMRTQRRAARRARHFAARDLDSDGMLNPEEFVSGRMRWFERLDADGDGSISAQEIENAPSHPGRRLWSRGGNP